jgi:hypothetical protein
MKFPGRILLVFFILIASLAAVDAQNASYNQWLDHLPYKQCISVAEAGSRIYSATPYSLIYFDKTDNSLNRLNKVSSSGLSDVGISSIAYCSSLNTLVVAYSNTNVDLIKGSDIINIPDIKRKQIQGNKTINSILIVDKLAYLACGFGIVVIDLAKNEIKDTYYIGSAGSQINVLSIAFHQPDNKFYAATEKGMLSADANTNLAYFVNWNKENITGPNDYTNLIASFLGKVYVNKTVYGVWDSDSIFVKDGEKWSKLKQSDAANHTSMQVCGERLVISNAYQVRSYKSDGTIHASFTQYNPTILVHPNDAIIDKDGKFWVADNEQGMWSIGSDQVAQNYTYDGPSSPLVAAMDVVGKQLWAVAGGTSTRFANLWRNAECYTLSNNSWSNFNRLNTPAMDPVRDIMCVVADPNDGSHAFMGSWGNGLLEFDKDGLKKIYNTQNSTLQYIDGYGDGTLRIGGLAFDNNNNLWVTNSEVYNVLSMRKPTGEWKSFNLSSLGSAPVVAGIVIDQENQKWIQTRDPILLVYNDNNTPDNPADDKMKKLTSTVGNGALPGISVSCMVIDRNGELWLGSDQGVSRIASPANVFNGGDYDAHPVEIVIDGFIHSLLATELITAITVNGNNEKWIGTEKAGVFLMSADGGKELLHFTAENSPLLSNFIQSIKISNTGEVYFGTSMGIVSYQDYKVESKSTLDSLFIYPNPVRPEYKGPVFISNLVNESNIKITDVSGALVWETIAQGGQVLWDGSDLEHRRVNTGIYLVFVTNADGSQKKTGKILFVR